MCPGMTASLSLIFSFQAKVENDALLLLHSIWDLLCSIQTKLTWHPMDWQVTQSSDSLGDQTTCQPVSCYHYYTDSEEIKTILWITKVKVEALKLYLLDMKVIWNIEKKCSKFWTLLGKSPRVCPHILVPPTADLLQQKVSSFFFLFT